MTGHGGVFESCAGLLSQNLQTVMEKAAEIDTEPARLSTYSPVAADFARTLFAILVALCNQGRAVHIWMNVERHNAAWLGLKR